MPEVTEFGAAAAMARENKPLPDKNPFFGLEDVGIRRLFAQWNREVEIPEIERQSKGKSKGLEIKLNPEVLVGYLTNRNLTQERINWMNSGNGVDEEAYKADRFIKYWDALSEDRKMVLIEGLEKPRHKKATSAAA